MGDNGDESFQGERLSARPGGGFIAHELRIQLLGDVAVATFHLWPEAPTVGRRTVVLRVRDGRWRIAHLHASLADKNTTFGRAFIRGASDPATWRPRVR